MRPPLIVGIGGSPDATSTTTRLLRDALGHAARRGATTTLFTGEQLAALPIYGAHRPQPSELAVALVEAVRRADGVVIATPGYHGGMSGLVKNALDHLEALRDDERPYLDGRAAAVIVSASGWQAVGTALVSVRSTIHALRGWPTPLGVTVNTLEQAPDDERVVGALAVLAGQVVDFATWHRG